MNVPLLDLKAQYAAIKTEVDSAIAEVLESQDFILGPKVDQCARAIAAYAECSYGREFFDLTASALAVAQSKNRGCTFLGPC